MEGCRVHKVAEKTSGHKINSKDREEVLERESLVSKFILLDRKRKEKKMKRKTGQKGSGGGGERVSYYLLVQYPEAAGVSSTFPIIQ